MGLFGAKRARKQLKSVLGDCEIPSFPEATMKLLRLIRDEDSSLSEIAEALQWDPGLVLRLLKTVNSAAYSPARPIRDVAQPKNSVRTASEEGGDF